MGVAKAAALSGGLTLVIGACAARSQVDGLAEYAVASATVETPSRVMPVESQVGPGESALATIGARDVTPGGSYSSVDVDGKLEIPSGAGPTSFTNCRIRGAIVTYSPLILDRCTVDAGVYSYDTWGVIDRSLITGDGQAFRPGTIDRADAYTTPTPWLVADTILRIPAGVPPAHVEAAQVLGGVGIVFRNVVFDTGGPFNNTQTASLNFIGKDLLCEDCWLMGYGGYALYSSGPNNRFIRPKFGRDSQFGLVYPNAADDPAPIIVDPTYSDGEPVVGLG
jgi:hypothetical protein